MTDRRPKGTPTGGQFAPRARAEVDVDLNEKPELTALPDGTEEWRLNGRLHREDGPAVVYPNGSESWWQHGRLHREDGPAVVWSDSYQAWWKNGRLHREDGPAVVWPDGRQEWWQHGRRVYPPPSVPA